MLKPKSRRNSRRKPWKNLLLCILPLAAHWYVFAQQLQAPAWPLAVKTPYLNSWYEFGTNPKSLSSVDVDLWSNTETSWYCSVVVDGVAYRIMGSTKVTKMTVDTPTQRSVQITPTQTIIQVQAGPINVTMNFMTPIMGDDLTRQSLSFSYLSLSVASADGAPHSVSIYSDLVALEWITGNSTAIGNATQDIDDNFAILQSSLNTPERFVEVEQQAQDAIVVFASKNNAGVRFGVGASNDIRNLGMNSTGLPNTITSDGGQLTTSDASAISINLGNITSTVSPIVYAVGLIRDPSIQFRQPTGGMQVRSPYYRLNFPTPSDAVSFFLDDFQNAANASTALDNQIISDALKISQDYADLLSLVTRQAMSAIDITVSENPDGSFNSSDIMAFMKDIGSVGAGGVNAVDVVYAAFPIYLYLNPAIGGYLLKPLLIAQDSHLYTQPYAAQQLGTSFPNATVEDLPHMLGIEQSGNMIIMLLAHFQASGDASLIQQHYGLIKGWADYLVNVSMSPGDQQPSLSDGITAINQTNLALKGIIGIGAMSRISSFLGEAGDASKYNVTARSYIEQWQSLSISQNETYLLTSFGSPGNNSGSAGLIYNLYADKLLQLGLVPRSVYDLQTLYYRSLNLTGEFGIPLDSSNITLTRADWMLFAAAAASDNELQSSMVSLVHSYAFTPGSSQAISPLYNPVSGVSSANGVNSPSMGALFSILALNVPVYLQANTTVAQPVLDSLTTSKSKTVVVVGSVVGGVAGLASSVIVILFACRRRTRRLDATRARPFTRTDDTPLSERFYHPTDVASRRILSSKYISRSSEAEVSRLTIQVDENSDRESLIENGIPRSCSVHSFSFPSECHAPPSYTTEEPNTLEG